MRVFIAGATGVLGRTTAELLTKAGHDVTGTARSPEGVKALELRGVKTVSPDLFDPGAVRDAIAGHDAVMHFATKIPPIMRMRSARAWDENNRLRREATKNLVDAAVHAGAMSYVQESITFIYADGGEEWIGEDSPVAPAWPAALDSTLDMEREAARFGEGRRKALILRYGAFYAPYARSTQDTVKMARRRMFGVIGDGRNYFSSIHVYDAARAGIAALQAPSGTYNIVEDEPVRQREYAAAIAQSFGTPRPMRVPRWLAQLFLGGPVRYITLSHRVSNRRFKKAASWQPDFPSVREGFASVAEAWKGKQ